MKQYRTVEQMCSDAHSIILRVYIFVLVSTSACNHIHYLLEVYTSLEF